jgi:hypothetical protein
VPDGAQHRVARDPDLAFWRLLEQLDGRIAAIERTGSRSELREVSPDPPAPGPDRVRLFARDNGAGKTQLCARFPTGAVQVISTEP